MTIRDVANIALILLFGTIIYMAGRRKDKIKELERQDQQAKSIIDSLKREYSTLSRRDSILWEQIEISHDSAKLFAQQAARYRKKYESLKNRPVPRLSDGQLDSVLSKFR